MSEGAVRARVLISGLVQGVFFRAETARTARRLGVCGWVRNLPGGSVEAAFEGPKPAVDSAIDWCRTGPPLARVDSVEATWEPPAGEGGFYIR
ncbi:MAG: acylphosphatase [Actinomycetota bacterium]